MYIFISGMIKNNRFILNLPSRFEGVYKVALVDCVVQSNFTKQMFLSLDICKESIVNEQYTSVLRRLDSKSVQYSHPLFVEIIPKTFSKLELSFLDTKLRYIDGVEFCCTLWLITH